MRTELLLHTLDFVLFRSPFTFVCADRLKELFTGILIKLFQFCHRFFIIIYFLQFIEFIIPYLALQTETQLRRNFSVKESHNSYLRSTSTFFIISYLRNLSWSKYKIRGSGKGLEKNRKKAGKKKWLEKEG